MKKYISNFILETEKILKGNIKKSNLDNLINKISFFSHERIIHLIITMFFALFSLIFTFLCFSICNILIYISTLIIYVILIFYVLHYYFLENSVQYLYKLYDLMVQKLK